MATQGLSPHSLGVATGSSIGMENISCVTAAQCRAGRNCPPLPGPISSSWLLWMFSQNAPWCLQWPQILPVELDGPRIAGTQHVPGLAACGGG